MKIRLIILLLSFVFFVGCNNETETVQVLTNSQRQHEIEAITTTIKNYNKATNARDWSALVNTLNDEVTFFGSDKGETSKDMAAFKETVKQQWEDYTTFEYGTIQDVYVEMDNYGTFANVIYGVPLSVVSKYGVSEELFVIVQRTLKKDMKNDKWVICSGILSIPRAEKPEASLAKSVNK